MTSGVSARERPDLPRGPLETLKNADQSDNERKEKSRILLCSKLRKVAVPGWRWQRGGGGDGP